MNERADRSAGPELAEQRDRLSALFETHADRLYRLARRLVPSSDDALDLVQDTFLKATRTSAAIPRGRSDEEAWLVRVLVNVRRDQWRREKVRRRHELQSRHTPTQQDDPETAFLIRTTVWRALEQLPPRRRAVLVMHEIEGLSMASIATTLGINAITVRWHLSIGRRQLARTLRVESGETNERRPERAVAGSRPHPSRGSAP
jgi:RNA polymerase sigma factor (sigma-70 family)